LNNSPPKRNGDYGSDANKAFFRNFTMQGEFGVNYKSREVSLIQSRESDLGNSVGKGISFQSLDKKKI
jgi:hypothetical protein